MPVTSVNLAIVRYGSVEDVTAALNKYRQNVASGGTIPYQQVTEPVPLLEDGSVYEDAIRNPAKYPYKTIDFFESKPVSWSKWNLPKSRA